MDAKYKILECFLDPIRFRKKLLEKAGLLVKSQRISGHAFMKRVRFWIHGEEAPKLGSSGMH